MLPPPCPVNQIPQQVVPPPPSVTSGGVLPAHPFLQQSANQRKFFIFRLTPSRRPDKIWDKQPLYEGGDSSKLLTGVEAEQQLALLGGAAVLPPFPAGSGDFFYDLARHTVGGKLSEIAREQIAAYKSRLTGGYCLGYRFTEDSGRFFYDLDGCRNPETGQLTAVGAEAVNFFRSMGAYIEVSASDCGIHVVGRYSTPRPAHGCKNELLGLELYTDGRGMAIGTSIEGNPDADGTGLLNLWLIPSYFPPSAAGPGGDKRPWSNEADPEWRGPESDEELLGLFLNGHKNSVPTNRQLWEGDAEALTAWKPELGRGDGIPFDATKADMLMASRGNFQTGNNFERTLRLMESSPYAEMRLTKWADNVLRRETIPNARSEDVYRDDYAVSKAGFGRAPLPEGASLVPTEVIVRSDAEYERRRKQIAVNIAIGRGVRVADCPTSPVVSLDQMLTDFCKIHSGNRVMDFKNPRSVYSYADWKSRLKQSMTFVEVKGDPYHDHATGGMKKKAYETLDVWNSHPSGRKEVETVTFRPGYGEVTVDPLSRSAANTWRPIERTATERSCELFLTHVEYLFGADAPRFLDWLAHIEQFPGDLPARQWVHVSPAQGTGRNLLASILCRVWEGYTAVNFDLPGALRNGFNEELSQKLLVTVDEIDAGGSNTRWSDSETLKSMVTATHRPINEKYGRKTVEWNSCRWLIFSNHMTALPLTEGDRRFDVVKNTRPRLPNAHYEQLFAVLNDHGFIASVAWMLKTRDISDFKPGAHAVMSEAKLEMIGASRSEVDDLITDLIESHPADVISSNALGAILNNQPLGAQLNAHQRHALDRAGTQSYGKQIKIAGKPVRVRILRNHEFWKSATPPQIQAELIKGSGIPVIT
jgi:primase-polymerase (primpol)-like protein